MEASCHLRQSDPFTTWFDAAEREIKELKKGYGRKMIKFRAPKRLWKDCLEEYYIKTNTAHGMYKLDWGVHETVMTGEIFNISQFCEFEWLDG